MEKPQFSKLISVSEAEKILLTEVRDYGIEEITIEKSLGRILVKSLNADRDFPPFDRVTMDGIAIKFDSFGKGNKVFKIQSTQSAGEIQQTLVAENECIEVMTGAIIPKNTDTVIRYEDLEILGGFAKILTEIKQSQNVHFKGEDRKKGTIIVPENTKIRAAEIAIAASIGVVKLTVKKLPKISIITSGDELVPIESTPKTQQIRTSNVYAIASILSKYGIEAEKIHISDELSKSEKSIKKALAENDILILSGGVSMGKKDFIPLALENLGVQKLFHKIAQTPGKPFWFGKIGGKLVFALPGNPVSTYLCMVRYFVPWLSKALNNNILEPEYAQLSEDFSIINSLTYFLQIKLINENAVLKAIPLKGHGSGDFANMVDGHAFLELPAYDRNEFKKGEIFKMWRF
jgi:molybdopterin molybdotransferase